MGSLLTRRPGDVTTRTSDQILEAIRKYSQRIVIDSNFGVGLPGGGNDPNTGLGPGPPVDTGTLFNDDVAIHPVAPTSDPGTEEWAARVGHQHEGVHSVAPVGSPTAIVGDALFDGRGGISVLRSGQTILIDGSGVAGSGGGGGGAGTTLLREVEYANFSPGSNKNYILKHKPVGDVAVYFDGFRRYKGRDYTENDEILTITFDGEIDFILADSAVFEYFWSPTPELLTGAFRVVEYYQILATSNLAFRLLYTPIGDVAVYFDGLRRFKGRDYSQVGCTVTFLSSQIAPIDGDTFMAEYWTLGDFCSDPIPIDGGIGASNTLDFTHASTSANAPLLIF